MPSYIVTWHHSIDAESPIQAAEAAMALIAISGDRTVFDIYGESPYVSRWRVSRGQAVDLDHLIPPVAAVSEVPVLKVALTARV